MKDEILYIFDDSSLIKDLPLNKVSNGANFFLCPLTVDQDKINSFQKKLRSSGLGQVTVIPFVKYFNDKAFAIRDEYIKFISDFANKPRFHGKNLKEYFKYPFKNFSLWWFSLIAEKNTSKTISFHKLVKILTIFDLRKKYCCKKVWLDINDNKLTHCILSNAKNEFLCKDLRRYYIDLKIFDLISNFTKTLRDIFFTLRRIFFIKLKMGGLKKRREILKNCRYLLVTYFPFTPDKELIKKKEFVDKYYQPLQVSLEKKYKGQVVWFAQDMDFSGFSWKEGISFGQELNKQENVIFFTKEFISFLDFLSAMIVAAYFAVKSFFIQSHLSNAFKYANLNVWLLFEDDWCSSFCGWTLLDGLLHYSVFHKAFKELSKDAVVLYIAENHAWEKALNIAISEKVYLKAIGIQHTIVPLLLLNYFDYKEDMKDGNYIQKVPKPDYLACVGKIMEDLFQKNGWPQNKIFILGAIRSQYLKSQIEKKIVWNTRENKVLVVLSIMPEESEGILLYVYNAFKDEKNYRIIIKPHPFLPISRLINFANIDLKRDVFEITSKPLNELLCISKVLIVAESSAALEGIACKCQVVIPRFANIVDMNPLSGFSDLPFYAEDSQELKEIVDKVMIARESPVSYEMCNIFVKNYFDFLSSDEEFLERLEAKL